MAGEEFKVTVESLHVNRIKEINYEGEEILQERSTVSQRLTELAQRADFTNSIESGESEPPPKKSTQKWPWEVPHSKLKHALTEIGVLSDVLQIIQNHRHYVALDPVLSTPMSTPSPIQQYIVKKKALEKAGDILKQGTVPLSKSSTRGEKEFHQTLSQMRKRWRLRRLANGVIVGDLGYNSAGSYMRPMFFEVTKREGGSGQEVIEVNVPRELRGRGEVVVFISEEPVQELPGLAFLTPTPTDLYASQQRKDLPAWERKLFDAQNVIFNQELFSMIAKEAYNQKPNIQHKVSSTKINVLLSPKCWLSVVHIHEYEGDAAAHSSPLPDTLTPNWSLTITLKQLLRDRHRKVSTLNKPHPATVGFSSSTKVSNASVVPSKGEELQELTIQKGVFTQFIAKAKHLYNEELVQKWMSELCSSTADPVLRATWLPSRSCSETVFSLTLASPSDPTQRGVVTVTLKVDRLCLKQVDGAEFTYIMEKERVMCALRHQVLLHQMQVVSSVAKSHKWVILQQFNRPLLSSSLLQSNEDYMMACSLSLQSPDAHKKLDVVLQWEGVSVSLTHFSTNVVTSTEDIQSIAPKNSAISLSSQQGQNFQQRFYNLLSSLNNL